MRTARSVTAALLLAAAPAAGQLGEVGNRLIERPGGATGQARYGSALAAGDFDDDGYEDLAIGGHNSLESGEVRGRVDVYRGGPAGLALTPWETFVGPQDDCDFGYALAAGDFDGDGRAELAVGAPFFDEVVSQSPVLDSGMVFLYEYEGSAWIAAGTLSQFGDVPGVVEPSDLFGTVLAVGRFDGGTSDDLAVAVGCEDVGTTNCAGAVNVFYGGPDGLEIAGSQIWHRGSGGGVAGEPEASESLGWAMAAGDFDADGADELAVSGPNRDVGGMDTGAVVVLFGSEDGLVATGQLDLDLEDVGGTANAWDYFGTSLAAGELDTFVSCPFPPCAEELLIGAVGASFVHEGLTYNGGQVFVLPGDAGNGPDPEGARILDQSTIPVGDPDWGEQFGSALAVGALDRRPGADVVIGSLDDAAVGAAFVLFGGSADLDGGEPQKLRAAPGFASAPGESADDFGATLAVADFDGDGFGDLAVGLPGRHDLPSNLAGAVQILYGALFADGFERGTAAGWSPQ